MYGKTLLFVFLSLFMLLPWASVEAEALYETPQNSPSDAIAKAPMINAKGDGWKEASLYVIHSELSPAILVHCKAKEITLFCNDRETKQQGPSFAVFATEKSLHTLKPGEEIPTPHLRENWIAIGYAGATGWNQWDSPWVIYLHHQPQSIGVYGDSGVRLVFEQEAGDLVLMPLYGYLKPPQETNQGEEVFKHQPIPVQPWKWPETLPEDVLQRIRYWAEVTREFPIYCEDTFSVNRSEDSVTIRQRFEWLSIYDDWNTPHRKLAPLPPALALAAMDKQFPVTFSQSIHDPQLFTPYGPYMGVENVDSYDSDFTVLKYIHETEIYSVPSDDVEPAVRTALEKLREQARSKFDDPHIYKYDHGGMNNFCWAIMGDRWYAKGLPFYDEETKEIALASLKKYFREDVLVPERFKEREFPKGSGKKYLILEGPGIGSWGVLGDAGKFSSNMLETLWSYAHFTGDWDLIQERWPLIKRLFCTPAEMNWSGVGRGTIAELGDEAVPCLAMARMAYRVGDIDTYNYAAYLFARELAHHYIKQRGAEYFRRNQPWHTMELLPEEVYLTNLWGDVAGWQIDGPTYPKVHGERQYNNRWVRFTNEDVGRFYYDYLRDDVRRELDTLLTRWEPKRRTNNDSHIMPSIVQLHSLLLLESPADLLKITSPDRLTGPASGVIASCLSFLRTHRPIHYQRLISGGEPSPFVTGVERERFEPTPWLVCAIETPAEIQEDQPHRDVWPNLRWFSWKNSQDKRWTFGRIIPSNNSSRREVQSYPLNWNTMVYAYDFDYGP